MVNKLIIPFFIALDALCLTLYYFIGTAEIVWTCFYYTIDKIFIVFLLSCVFIRKQIKPYDKIFLIYGLMVNGSMWVLNTLAIYSSAEITRANISIYRWLLFGSLTLLLWRTAKEVINDARKRNPPV